ncbi:hypothetical protein [Neptunicella sp. SCSIO 80796]|uniref:hypothetical protein n=1 Tax=Neptunicella plasticusilytica TaxID=3117012 RepID=UPI003A4E13CE
MLRPLVKITLVHLLWRNYKPVLLATLFAIIGFVVVSLIHSDYVQYAQDLPGDKDLGLSFIIKWVCYFAIIAGWLAVCFHSGKQKKHIEKIQISAQQVPIYDTPEDDPFNTIRQKDKLRSRADWVVEKHKE